VNLVGFGPARETGHDVELFQQLCDEVLCVGVFGESIEVGDDLEEGVLCVFNGLGAEVFALCLQALVMFKEFFPIKFGQRRNRRRRRGIQQKAWDSGSCPRHIGLTAV